MLRFFIFFRGEFINFCRILKKKTNKPKTKKLIEKNLKKKTYGESGILSISNSTPSLSNTNISLTKGTGIPFGNSWGFNAIIERNWIDPNSKLLWWSSSSLLSKEHERVWFCIFFNRTQPVERVFLERPARCQAHVLPSFHNFPHGTPSLYY